MRGTGRKLALVPVVVLAAIAVFGSQAVAAGGNAHFLYATTSVSGSNLNVSFKEAGLGTNISQVTITVSATATVNEFCVNNGGSNPSASNKRTSTSQLSQGFQVNVSNGTTGDVTVTVNPPPPSLSCPGGQTPTIGSVTYSNIWVNDFANAASIHATPDPIGTGCLLPPGTKLKAGVTC